MDRKTLSTMILWGSFVQHLESGAHDHQALDSLLDALQGGLDDIGKVVEALQLLTEYRVHAFVPTHWIANLCGFHIELRGNLSMVWMGNGQGAILLSGTVSDTSSLRARLNW